MTLGRFVKYLLLLLAAVYCGITAYPRLLFSSVHEAGNIGFYAREPVSGSEPIFARVYEAAGSGYFSDPDRTLEVYLTGSDGEYLFFAPFCWKHRSCVHPVSGKVFIAPSDLASNTAYDFGEDSAPRFLNSVIVHELAKAQLRNKLGLTSYILLQDWKKTGYAEHVAMETAAIATSAICGEDAGDNELNGYLEARLMVEMLITEDGENYPSLMDKNQLYALLRERLMKKYCKGI
jgi:hypothetical protein